MMKTTMVLVARAGRAALLLATTVFLLAVGGAALAHELVRGTEGPDELAGDRHSNRVVGLGGDDSLRGRGGSDDLRGGEGNDVLRSGRSGAFGSRDVAFGGPGDDKFYGFVNTEQYDAPAVNFVYGGDGDDLYRANESLARVASGGEGGDDLYGGPGNDELRGGGGADSLFAGDSCAFLPGPSEHAECEFFYEPDNRLYGGRGDDDLHGSQDTFQNEGDGDLLDGAEGRDLLDGGHGDDFELRGGPGEDTITGGGGDDTVYAQDGEKDEVDCGGNRSAGGDTAYFDEGLDVLSGCEAENPTTTP